jgi:hypothetical protein
MRVDNSTGKCVSVTGTAGVHVSHQCVVYPNFNKKFVDKLELTVNRLSVFRRLFPLRLLQPTAQDYDIKCLRARLNSCAESRGEQGGSDFW